MHSKRSRAAPLRFWFQYYVSRPFVDAARARLVAVWRCCCSRARAQLIEVAFCNFGGGAINVYVLYRRHLVVFARLPPPSEVWVPCFSATAFWVGFLSARTIEGLQWAEL